MKSLATDFKELLQQFAQHNVEYLLVGGYAVAVHGHPRYTGDLDLWVKGDTSNAERIVSALKAFGIDSPDLTVDAFCRPKSLITFGREPLKVEIMNHISGVDFASCKARELQFEADGVSIFVISREDLLANKRSAGRYKDLGDVEALEGTDIHPE